MNSTSQFSREDKKILLEIARQSVLHGLSTGRPLPVKVTDYSHQLQEQRASFVTLKKDGQLRGCIGMLEAVRPVVEDVSENAFSAAFRDSRFAPVTADEIDMMDFHISILSAPQPIEFSSEQDLLKKIRPNIDGLILVDGNRRGTFLPTVWESLPDPKNFLQQLKLKAGLSKNEWSEKIRILRYQTESIGTDCE
ncbi:MAG TPA: AmmeMemoRadiSam system protein A [Crenotrichaceae bacterium]|nr:AmmeMemoRadiSam system protein A [Crenotrichaceae bacterium]